MDKQLEKYIESFIIMSLNSKIKRIKRKIAKDLGYQKWEDIPSSILREDENLKLIEEKMMESMAEPKCITNRFDGEVKTGELEYVQIDDYRFVLDENYVDVILVTDGERVILDEIQTEEFIKDYKGLRAFAIEWLVRNVKVEEELEWNLN